MQNNNYDVMLITFKQVNYVLLPIPELGDKQRTGKLLKCLASTRVL